MTEPSNQRPILWGFFALVILVLGLGAFAAYQTRKGSAFHAQADQAAQASIQSAKEAQEADQRTKEAREAREKVTQEVDRLTAALKAAARPPAPLPAPETDPDLAKGLETAGLQVGLVVFREGSPSRLERQDAVKVWNWSQEALRIPALELRLGAAENLVAGHEQETGALTVELREVGTARDHWQAAYDGQFGRAEALQGEVTSLHKAATARKWQTWAMVAGSAVAGYLAGRH